MAKQSAQSESKAPKIESFDPPAGWFGESVEITVRGSGFEGIRKAEVNRLEAKFENVSDSEVKVFTPKNVKTITALFLQNLYGSDIVGPGIEVERQQAEAERLAAAQAVETETI